MKVFSDFIADYQDLQFIFEYGFYWDDKVTQELYEKGSQMIRELERILEEKVHLNEPCIAWSESLNGKKKSRRHLIWLNHYKLVQNRWFHRLYGCYGIGLLDIRGEGHNPRRSQMEEEKELFRQLAVSKNGVDPTEWGGYISFDKFYREHQDVIIKQGSERRGYKYKLKENMWTFEKMKDLGLLKTESDYEHFLEMLCFFSDFAPLSVLGGHFLRKLGGNEIFKKTATVLVRNLPANYALEQEYIYRSLYAMVNCRNIRYGKKEYLPLMLGYLDCGISGMEENLYLKARDLQSGALCLLPLRDGVYIEAGHRAVKSTEQASDWNAGLEDEKVKLEVDFFYHSQAEYLCERRERNWSGYYEKVVALEQTYKLDSPYDSIQREWQIERVTYCIPKRDLPGFLLFVRSFGDFAKLLRKCEEIEPEAVQRGEAIRSRDVGEQSLLSMYHSEALQAVLEEEGRQPAPKRPELEWVLFVLENYPNMCRIFMENDILERIRMHLANEVGDLKWFRKEYFACRSRVKDLFPEKVRKYQKIVEAVRRHQILEYEYEHRMVKLYPYALEYDVTEHLASGKKQPVLIREPLDIMCYSLTAKRNIKVLTSRIRTNDIKEREEIAFSDLEKLYHILAYAVRCALFDKQEIGGKVNAVIEELWKKDSRGQNNYNRRIRKRYGKTVNFQYEYDRLSELIQNSAEIGEVTQQEAMTFQAEVFGYWACQEKKDMAGDLQGQYQSFLLMLFREACERLWLPRAGKLLKEQLDQFSTEEIWELISGMDSDIEGMEIPGEIAFYNEVLKNDTVSFCLKRGFERKIDTVYRLFRCFICAGDWHPDGRICFNVTYEAFYYRKIHMILMALADWIEDIKPENTADIIRKRRKNMEDIKWKEVY